MRSSSSQSPDTDNLLRELQEELASLKGQVARRRENEERFRSVTDNSPFGYTLSRRDELIYMNPACARIFGFSEPGEMMGKTPWDFSPEVQPDGANSFEKGMGLIEKTLQGQPQVFEWRHLTRTGQPVDVQIQLAPIPLEEGLCILGCIRDISGRKEIEGALKERDQRFQVLFEASSDAIAVMEEGVFIEVNEAAVRLYGYPSKDALIGLGPQEISAEIQADGTASALLIKKFIGLWQRNGWVRFEWRHRRPDGTVWDAEVTLNRVYFKGKACILSNARDISQRKENEQHLRHISSVLRAVRNVNQLVNRERDPHRFVEKVTRILTQDRGFNNVWCALLNEERQVSFLAQCDGEGRVLSTEQGENRLGTPPCLEKLTLSRLPLVISPSEDICLECRFGQTETGAFHMVGKIQYEDQLKGILVISAKDQKVFSDEERMLIFEVCEDMGFALQNMQAESERRRAFEEMAVAKRQAESANKAKEEFLATVSHELRTPLNPILGFATILRESAEDSQAEALDHIIMAGERQLRLIERILEFTRLDRMNIQPVCSEILLKDFLEITFSQTTPRISFLEYYRQHPLPGTSRIPPDLAVSCDSDMILKIIENLVHNAFKYTKKGTVELGYGITNEVKNSVELKIEVKDSGIGMSRETISKIFDSFYQADSSSSRQYEGLGLGLALCRKMVDILGGSIDVDSELGKGSCFRVTLPLKVVGGLAAEAISGQVKGGTDSNNLSELPVLIVEDDRQNIEIIRILIHSKGIQTRHAENGREAVDLCQSQPFCAILMDLRMPEMDGFEAARLIRNEGNLNGDTPIIALTADVSDSARSKAIQSGMSDFLVKPVSPEKLFATLEQILSGGLKAHDYSCRRA